MPQETTIVRGRRPPRGSRGGPSTRTARANGGRTRCWVPVFLHRTPHTLEQAREKRIPRSRLNAFANPVIIYNGRAVVLNSLKVDSFTAKRIRGVFDQGIKLAVDIEQETCQPHRIAKLNSRTKIPTVESLRQWRKRATGVTETKTGEHRPLAAVPRSYPCEETPDQRAHRRG